MTSHVRARSVSVVVTAHREGLLAWPSLQSLDRAVRFVRDRGHVVEIIVTLDQADAATRAVVLSWAEPEVTVLTCEVGDPGLARNLAVASAKCEFIAFLDSDDLWGENWLAAALEAATADPRDIVWHSEVSIYFGGENYIFRNIDMEAEDFKLDSLLFSNYWSCLFFCSTERMRRTKFGPTDRGKRLGHEDWAWHRDSILDGAIHKVVKGTGHFVRLKTVNSVNKNNAFARVMPRPTRLFRKILEDRQRLKARSTPYGA